MEYEFFVMDVFTDKKFEGNQLSIFPSSDGLDDETMQKIAREFNYSETIFVSSDNKENVKNVRIFTPESEVDFAGHPNIGAAMLLARIGKYSDEKQIDIIFKEKVGDVPIRIYFEDSIPQNAELSTAKLPEKRDSPSMESIAKSISLDVSDIVSSPLSFSCGLPFLFVQISSLEKLKQATLNQEHWNNHISQCWAPQLYLFTKETVLSDSNFHARMFAPSLGITEDPATGSAAAALAGVISECFEKNDGNFTYVIEQGFEMNRPSIIEMSFTQKNQKIESVKIKGNAVIFSKGTINV